MKKIIILGLILSILSFSLPVSAMGNATKSLTLSNKLFRISLPYNTKGTYLVKKKSNGIFIYDKISKKAGFGGFAFGIKAYANPSDHATMPGSRKLGELNTKNGNIYDIVLIQPTDVQYDYVNGISTSYKLLYDYGNKVIINGNNNNIYVRGQGSKGEGLYDEIIKKHILAIEEKWNSKKLEQEDMSYMYNVLSKKKIKIF